MTSAYICAALSIRRRARKLVPLRFQARSGLPAFSRTRMCGMPNIQDVWLLIGNIPAHPPQTPWSAHWLGHAVCGRVREASPVPINRNVKPTFTTPVFGSALSPHAQARPCHCLASSSKANQSSCPRACRPLQHTPPSQPNFRGSFAPDPSPFQSDSRLWREMEIRYECPKRKEFNRRTYMMAKAF